MVVRTNLNFVLNVKVVLSVIMTRSKSPENSSSSAEPYHSEALTRLRLKSPGPNSALSSPSPRRDSRPQALPRDMRPPLPLSATPNGSLHPLRVARAGPFVHSYVVGGPGPRPRRAGPLSRARSFALNRVERSRGPVVGLGPAEDPVILSGGADRRAGPPAL